jgi:CheY-like chemotaxis protein
MRNARAKITVLYVEDDALNQQVLESMLQAHEDIQLLLASDEADVEEILEDRDAMPDVVLMDSQLINTTGLEVRNVTGQCTAVITAGAARILCSQSLQRGMRASVRDCAQA